MSVFKDFPGLENLEKIQGLSKTFKDPQEPCTLFTCVMWLPGKLSCKSYRAMLMVQPVLSLKMTAVTVHHGFEQQAVQHQPGRLAPVYT